ncbi:MAG: TraB/GumN family protein [Proteobacteria bacterium]|nr:TraB/GumN family protein [Pseudomonadota bacterium]
MSRLALLLGLLLAAPVSADPLLYRINDSDSTVWLLGSVHALRSSDYPLDEHIESAYRRADRVILEVDPAELEPAYIAGLMTSLARYENGKLSDAFSTEEFEHLQEQLATLGVDVHQLQPFEPWFVALQVFGLNLARNGFAHAEGVDSHYAARAAEDGKSTGGLETARAQFALFDNLPLETQKTFLSETVADSEDFRDEMTRLVENWRRGDTQALEQLIEDEFAHEPELRESMLDARNRNWVQPIIDFLDEPGETLVIVGALHLVGDEGVIELLREKGHEVERVANTE